MNGYGATWRVAGLLAAGLLLSACASRLLGGGGAGGEHGINAYPANYKADILAAMHAYLNDPTGIRQAEISEPMLKSVGDHTHYLVCLRFDAKFDGRAYGGIRQIAAVFLAGRLDNFVDATAAKEPCAGVAYTPFPELEHLPR